MQTRIWTVLLCLVIHTICLPASVGAYRTVIDSPDFDIASQTKISWANSQLTFFVRATDPYAAQTATALAQFEQALSQISCSAASIAFATDPAPASLSERSDGRNTIYVVGDGWTQYLSLPSDKMAVTELEYEQGTDGTWSIVEADILINAMTYAYFLSPDTALPSQTRSLPGMLFHELAHALGLLHVCESDGALGAPSCSGDASYASRMMYPEYTGHDQRLFSGDDIAGLCFLYPASTCAVTCGLGEVCTAGGCAVTCADTVCDVGDVCIDGACHASCGERLCASTDVCLDGECRASCQSDRVICPYATICSDDARCTTTCESATCAQRACTDAEACPAGLRCEDGFCRDLPDSSSACRKDDDCEPSSRCISSHCRARYARESDPCLVNEECISGLCIDAVCRRTCGLTCGAPRMCLATNDAMYCGAVEGRVDFGEACATGAQCASGACLVEDALPQTCTRSCDLDVDDCPRGNECTALVDGTYCVPQSNGGGGCVTAASARREKSPSTAFCIAVLIALRIRRRGNK